MQAVALCLPQHEMATAHLSTQLPRAASTSRVHSDYDLRFRRHWLNGSTLLSNNDFFLLEAQRHPYTSSALKQEDEKKGFFGRQMDKLQGKVEDKQKQQSNDAFKQMVQQMISVDAFTMEHYYQLLKKNVDDMSSGWRGKAADLANMPEVKEAKQTVAILDAMTAADRRGLSPKRGVGQLKPAQVTRISQESGYTESEVHMVVNKFFQHEAFAKFIRHRVRKKLPMPRTMNEAQRILQTNTGRQGLTQNDMMKIMGGERAAGVRRPGNKY